MVDLRINWAFSNSVNATNGHSHWKPKLKVLRRTRPDATCIMLQKCPLIYRLHHSFRSSKHVDRKIASMGKSAETPYQKPQAKTPQAKTLAPTWILRIRRSFLQEIASTARSYMDTPDSVDKLLCFLPLGKT